MKKLMIVVFLVGFLSIGAGFGNINFSNNAVLTARAAGNFETVSMEDLGVKNPGLLPTNPFYFLKEFNRVIQRAFTFNPVAKAELELKITNEKVAEAKKIQEIVPNDNKAITKGLENYKKAQDKLKTSLESLSGASSTPSVVKLLNSVSDNIVLHQKVLDEISVGASDSVEIKNEVGLAKEKNNKISVVVIKDSFDGFMAGPGVSTTTQNIFFECDNLKISLEKITSEMKEGNLTDEQFKIKYENLKKELEKCINSKQPQPVSSTVKTAEKSSNCDFLKKYPSDLEMMLKKGEISEKDYNSKLEIIKKELERCSGNSSLEDSKKESEQIFCTQEYDPVCGTDGKTYSNECMAKGHKIEVKFKGECGTSSGVSSSGVVIKEDCGQEKEKVNRDPLVGPVNKSCCYGLKEDRSNKLYSICFKPEENSSDVSVSGDGTSATIACPMLTPVSPELEKSCVEKGGKMAVTQDENGCYSPPKCVPSATPASFSQ